MVECEETCCVQVRPLLSDTVMTDDALAPTETMATSSDPGGGVNAAVVTGVYEAVTEETAAGLEASSAIAAAARISSSAVCPPTDGALAPTVVAPGVPVTLVVRHDPRTSPFWVSTTLSRSVVPAAAVRAVVLLVLSVPSTRLPVSV